VHLREITRQDFTLTVDKGLPGITLNGDPELPVNRVAAMHNPLNRCCRFTKGYRFLQMSRAKGPSVLENLDRFKPVGFSLTVIAIENVNSVGAIDLAGEIAKAIDGD